MKFDYMFVINFYFVVEMVEFQCNYNLIFIYLNVFNKMHMLRPQFAGLYPKYASEDFERSFYSKLWSEVILCCSYVRGINRPVSVFGIYLFDSYFLVPLFFKPSDHSSPAAVSSTVLSHLLVLFLFNLLFYLYSFIC